MHTPCLRLSFAGSESELEGPLLESAINYHVLGLVCPIPPVICSHLPLVVLAFCDDYASNPARSEYLASRGQRSDIVTADVSLCIRVSAVDLGGTGEDQRGELKSRLERPTSPAHGEA